MSTMCKLRSIYRVTGSFCRYKEFRRCLLSDAYQCSDAWKERFSSPALANINLNELSIKMQQSYQRNTKCDAIDMDIYANKIEKMDDYDVDVLDYLVYQFRHSPMAYPLKPSIIHGITRALADNHYEERLVRMMNDKINYGLLPDPYTANLLMDHCIKENKFKEAATIAYEMMLQEDFSNKVTFYLALFSCVKHVDNVPLNGEGEDTYGQDDENEDVEWVPVKFVYQIVYDDHFDIKEEAFLMGKTLAMIGKTLENSLLSRSLIVAGYGLYNKFEKVFDLLNDWAEKLEGPLVTEDALNLLQRCVQATPTRDPEKPLPELSLRTMDDVVYQLRATQEEKDSFIANFTKISQNIRSRVSEKSMKTLAEDLVRSEINQHESKDITEQREKFKNWVTDREKRVKEQMKTFLRNQKEEEIKQKLLDLQEKEDILTYFENENEIQIIRQSQKDVKEKLVKELDEDELRDLLAAKSKTSAIKKKK